MQKTTQDLIAEARTINQHALRGPDFLAPELKKYDKLRLKKDAAERTAITKIEKLLSKPQTPSKPLNRPQYILARTLGFITHPIAQPFSGMAVVLPCFLLTDNFFTGLGLSVVATASVGMLSKNVLPRLNSRAEAVQYVIPVLDRLSDSQSADFQKCIERIAGMLNTPNLSSTFWSECYDILIDVDWETKNCKAQEKVVQRHQKTTAESVSVECVTLEGAAPVTPHRNTFKL